MSLATGVADPALTTISRNVGQTVAGMVPATPTSDPSIAPLRADPFIPTVGGIRAVGVSDQMSR